MKLANRVRELRYKKGWGPEELALHAKVSRTAVYHLESGRTVRPQAGTLRKIARALEVTPEELLRQCEVKGQTQTPAPAGQPTEPSAGERPPRGRKPRTAAAVASTAVPASPGDPGAAASNVLHRLGQILGLPTQNFSPDDLFLNELARPSLAGENPQGEPAGPDEEPSGLSPQAARQLIEKFAILLCSPMAKGIAQIVEESFRLLPILPAIASRNDLMYGYAPRPADREPRPSDTAIQPRAMKRAN